MEKRFIEKTTFSEICKLMKGGKKEDWVAIQGFFDLAVLFLPALSCPELAFFGKLACGADLLAAKSVLVNTGKAVYELFAQKNPVDFTTRYENAQAAQVLMVFSAYFDSIQLYLPNEWGEIALSDGEKLSITKKSLEEYSTWIKSRSSERTSQEAKDILEYCLDLRAPLESKSDYRARLIDFYNILNKQFLFFYDKLSFSEEITEAQKDRFMAVFRHLPETAYQNYEKQYVELKNTSEAFRIWADTQEHIGISKQIDVGFRTLSTQIAKYVEEYSCKGTHTLNKYTKLYDDYISDTLVKTAEMNVEASDGVVFPAKKDIFIPQSFKALRYDKRVSLEAEKTWDTVPERDEIGVFIAETLRHSTTGKLPLLILGVPGAGKTLLCHMLAAQILSHEYHVLIIRLRDTVADDTITQQINEQIERDFANHCTWDDIADHAVSKPVLLIFDGYDELLQASGRTYANYLSNIVEFQRQQFITSGVQVKCILTSRTTLIDKASIPVGTTVIKLSDFDSGRIWQWSDIWNNYNRSYFEMHHLDSFSVTPDSKVYELAKQPLLLLLLALYDTNENALKKNADLTGAQLYDRIIKDFIAREQRKDSGFSACQDSKQCEIIQAEMYKVSIAALGMYNRRVLYIRSEELEKDLNYLMPKKDVSEKKEYTGELQNSEKLLGSFFFIHRSDSRGSIQHVDTKNTAYEFLHNTFGEFLTANYIVSELYEELDNTRMFLQNGRIRQWKLCEEKNWFCALSYAPLSSRPVVVKMVREQAPSYFAEHGLKQEEITSAMEQILREEFEHVISGDAIFSLDKILSENGNPFEKKAYFFHLACYSLNLLCLGALVCGDAFSFSCDNHSWDKIICLWRYAFSEEELLDMANLFRAERSKTSCCLRYYPAEEEISGSEQRILRLERIGQAIGDSLSTALISTILGDGDTDSVLEVLSQNKLNVSTKYLWNKSMRVISEDNNDVQTCEYLLDYFSRSFYEQGTLQDFFSYYLLLEYFSKFDKRVLNSKHYIRAFEMGLRYLEIYERRPYRNGIEPDYCVQVEKILVSLVERLPLRRADWAFLIYCCQKTKSLEMYLIIFSRLIKETNAGRIRRDELISFLKQGNEIDAVNYYSDHFVSDSRKMSYSFSNYLELTYQFLLLEPRLFPQQFDIMISNFFRVVSRKRTKISVPEYAQIIRCLKLLTGTDTWSSEYIQIVNRVLSKVSFLKIYKYSPDAAYDLCCLIETADVECKNLMDDFDWILKNNEEELSVRFYRKIHSLLDKQQSDFPSAFVEGT